METFAERFKNDLQKPRFWLELLALLVVAFYTCQAKIANDLTRKSLAQSLMYRRLARKKTEERFR